jgi:hypothetical protein
MNRPVIMKEFDQFFAKVDKNKDGMMFVRDTMTFAY